MEKRIEEGQTTPRQGMIEFFNEHPAQAHVLIGIEKMIADKDGNKGMKIQGMGFSLPNGQKIPLTVGMVLGVLMADEEKADGG